MTQATSEPMAESGRSIFLPKTGTWPAAWYWMDQRSQDAIQLALACGRPLLVRGLPGTGKSDLARAAAEFLGRAFVYEVISARTEPQDLLWRFDTIARLADAQVKGAGVPATSTDPADPSNPLHYVSPGVLWWSLHWQCACDHVENHGKHATQRPDPELVMEDKTSVQQQVRAMQNGCVLLLDEIDKADSDLPNSLLEVLANQGFRLPWGDVAIPPKAGPSVPRPLIIITTNEDRELPTAFVRRCLVLNLEADADFGKWIKERARVHFRSEEECEAKDKPKPIMAQSVINKAADYLLQEHKTLAIGTQKPGLAEVLDLLRGLAELAPNDPEVQLQWLDRVYGFAYCKRPPGGS